MAISPNPPEQPDGEELSLERLSQAYAQAMGTGNARRKARESVQRTATAVAEDPDRSLDDQRETDAEANGDEAPLTPAAILEAMLFVGQPDNVPLSAEEVSSLMRGISVAEVEAIVGQLNEKYAERQNAFEIVRDGAGFRMRLREEFARLRDVFHGRTREITLSQAAVDVLALVAYKQPVTVDEINQLRGISSGGTVRQLVRRRLIRFELHPDDQRTKCYYTTRRMLNLLGLESLDDLPQSDDA